MVRQGTHRTQRMPHDDDARIRFFRSAMLPKWPSSGMSTLKTVLSLPRSVILRLASSIIIKVPLLILQLPSAWRCCRLSHHHCTLLHHECSGPWLFWCVLVYAGAMHSPPVPSTRNEPSSERFLLRFCGLVPIWLNFTVTVLFTVKIWFTNARSTTQVRSALSKENDD